MKPDDDGIMWKNVLKSCQQQGKKFTDLEFQPVDYRIGGNFKADWKRASEIFSSNYKVFAKGIEPNDII